MERRLDVVSEGMTQLVLLPEHDGDVDQLRGIQSRAEEAIATVSRHVGTLRERQREMRSKLGNANVELSEAEERREELERSTRTLGDSLSALEIELAELAVRQEAVCEIEAPELAQGGDARDRLESLQADLKRMGPINPLAAQEHAEIAAEADELDSQLGDLNESRQERSTRRWSRCSWLPSRRSRSSIRRTSLLCSLVESAT